MVDPASRDVLRFIGTAALHAFGLTYAIAQPQTAEATPCAGDIPISVELTSAAEDKMTRRLTSAVAKALRRDPRFALAERGSRGVVIISLPSHLGWQRRLDWTEISYQARLSSEKGESRVITGHCWNWNLGGCAGLITDAVIQFYEIPQGAVCRFRQ